MQRVKYECLKYLGEYFKTAEIIRSYLTKKHITDSEKLTYNNNNNVFENYFETVQESGLQKLEENSQLEYCNSDEEYCDALDVISDVEPSSTNNIVNLPGLSLAMSSYLLTERNPKTFRIKDNETNCTMKKFPSLSYDTTHGVNVDILEHEENFKLTDIEITSSDNEALSSLSDMPMEENMDPYYCPDCGKGLGYSLNSFNAHVGNKEFCKQYNSGEIIYTCQYCKTDYSRLHTLKKHNKKFGVSCKNRQISMNREKLLSNPGSEIPQRVVPHFEPKDTESTRDNSKLHSPRHLTTEEESNPYYCSDCGRGLGYSFTSFQNHIARYTGHCREKFSGKRVYGCRYCKHEFLTFSALKKHSKYFRDTCKTRQLSMNTKSIIHNFNGEVRESIRNESESLAGASLTNDELLSLCNNAKRVQKNGPYSCPLCGRKVGFSILKLKRHIIIYKGNCKEACPSKYYPCQYCGTDFLSLYTVRCHNKMFGDKCKHWHKRIYPSKKRTKLDHTGSETEEIHSDGNYINQPSPFVNNTTDMSL